MQQLRNASQSPEKVIILADNHSEQMRRETALKAKSFSDNGAAIYLAKGRIKENTSHVFIHEAFARADKIRGVESFVHSIKLDPVKTEKSTLKLRFSKLLRQKRFDENTLKTKTRPLAFEHLPYYMILTQNEKKSILQYVVAHQDFKANDNLQSARKRMHQSKAAIAIFSSKIKQLYSHPQYQYFLKKINSNEIKFLLNHHKKISVTDFLAIAQHMRQLGIDKSTENAIEQYANSVKKNIPQDQLKALFNREQTDFIKDLADNAFNTNDFANQSNIQKVVRDINRSLSSHSKEVNLDKEQDRGR